MPNSTEVMSPVVDVTTFMPSRKAKASMGSMPNVNGNISARVTGPPSPGQNPDREADDDADEHQHHRVWAEDL